MLAILIILALVLVILFQWAQLRAVRAHTSIMTVVHGDFNALVAELKTLRAKLDGGTDQK